jgi:hypothetical protein
MEIAIMGLIALVFIGALISAGEKRECIVRTYVVKLPSPSFAEGQFVRHISDGRRGVIISAHTEYRHIEKLGYRNVFSGWYSVRFPRNSGYFTLSCKEFELRPDA